MPVSQQKLRCENLGVTLRRHLPRRRQRGYTLMMSIIVLLAFLVIGVSCLNLATNSMQAMGRQADSMRALNIAEAYADYAEAWVRKQPTLPLLTDYPDGIDMIKKLSPITVDDSADKATCTSLMLWPDKDNATLGQRRFTIISTGVYHGMTRSIIYQLREQSFSLYMYFTDAEQSPGGSTINFIPSDHVYGPVHTNGQFHITWSSTASTPIFNDSVSSANTSVVWTGGTPSTDAQWKKILAGGKAALTLGVDTIPLPSSTDKQRQAAWGYPNNPANYPESQSPVLADGVYVAHDASNKAIGGIYIKGNTPAITFIADTPGVQKIKMSNTSTSATPPCSLSVSTNSSRVPPTGTTYTLTTTETTTTTVPITLVVQDMTGNTVTLKKGTDTYVTTLTTVQNYKSGSKNGSATVTTSTQLQSESLPANQISTYSGLTNGVIYTTGDIGSSAPLKNSNGTSLTGVPFGLSGTLVDNLNDGTKITTRNAWTISTDVLSGKDIYISDDLLYQTQQSSSYTTNPGADPNYCLKAASLGLVADCVNVTNDDVNTPSGVRTIDASILTGSANSTTGSFTVIDYDKSGVLKGNLHVQGGLIQKYRGPVGTSNNGTAVTGYSKDYVYDSRLGSSPTPFFPADGNFDMISWQYR